MYENETKACIKFSCRFTLYSYLFIRSFFLSVKRPTVFVLIMIDFFFYFRLIYFLRVVFDSQDVALMFKITYCIVYKPLKLTLLYRTLFSVSVISLQRYFCCWFFSSVTVKESDKSSLNFSLYPKDVLSNFERSGTKTLYA